MEKSTQTDTVPQTGPPLRNYRAKIKAEIVRTERMEQRHEEGMGQLREQVASREVEVKKMFDEHLVASKAKEKEVLDLHIALTEAKERVLKEEERNRQWEHELFAENEELRSQQREWKEMANEFMLKWRIAEEQKAQLSDSFNELQVEGIVTRERLRGAWKRK